MSFFKNLFSFSGSKNTVNIPFGRYSDSFKSDEKVKAWDKAKELFEQKKYLESYDQFFNYLKDDATNNVSFSKTPEQLTFSISQGSKIVKGFADASTVVAEVNLAQFEKASVSWMRKLMTLNFTLQYSRFAIKDDKICMKFSTKTLDGSPNKLYYSLKELCTKADRHDNILSEEFSSLKQIDIEHVIPIDENQKEIKYKYLQRWINEILKRTDELHEDKFAGAISYLLLSLTYKIDYLITPEGVLLSDLERIQDIYFSGDSRTYPQRNSLIKEEYRKMLLKPKEYVFQNLYQVKSTFGVMNPSSVTQVTDFLNEESTKTTWYKDNKYPDIVKSIYEYITGYCLFNFGMPKPTKKLLHLFMHIANQDFFTELGYKENFHDGTKINKQAVETSVSEIIHEERKIYPKLNFNLSSVHFNNFSDFATSFLKEFSNINLSK